MKHSLQRKLLYSFMLVIIVMLIGVSLGVLLIVKEEMVANKQQEMIAKGSELAEAVISFQKGHGSLAQLPEFLTSIDGFIDSRVWVVNASRQVIAMSPSQRGLGGRMREMHDMRGAGPKMGPGPIPGSMPNLMDANGPVQQSGIKFILNELDQVFEGQIWTKIFDHPFYGEKMLVVAVPIIASDSSVMGAVILNAPVTAINVFMEHIYYYIGVAGLVAFLLALLVVSRLTRGVVRPLREMEKTAGAMARGDYSTYVKIESHDEVGNLGVALNSLAQDLAKYISELEQMEKLRRDFVANISHEFRTPMTIIRGYNEALMDGTVKDSELIQKYHQLIGDETVRLEHLISDLLDLSRLQSTVHTDKEKLPLVALADSVINLIKQQAEQKQVAIVANTQQSLPMIWGNGDRLLQLLLIIMDNALKYTPAGGCITVTTSLEEEQVVVKISDTGIGIPAADLPYIWERLYKVDKSHCRADGGTGLGLAIAKQIIDLHQAKATVLSELGQGTTFIIRFPIAETEQNS